MDYPRIKNSRYKDISILLLDNNERILIDHEVRFENDQDLSRTNIYVSTTLSEAASLVRRNSINLVIFGRTQDSSDFVQIQLELKSGRDEIDFIPCIDLNDLDKINESLRVGNVYTYKSKDTIYSYDNIKGCIFEYIRDASRNNNILEPKLEKSALIMRTFCSINTNRKKIKNYSHELTIDLLTYYDLSNEECLQGLAAEKIYSPELSQDVYEYILDDDIHQFLPILQQCGTWEGSIKSPASVLGFVITLANYLSHEIIKGGQQKDIILDIINRPSFLLHPAIRVFTKENLITIFNNLVPEEFLKKVA